MTNIDLYLITRPRLSNNSPRFCRAFTPPDPPPPEVIAITPESKVNNTFLSFKGPYKALKGPKKSLIRPLNRFTMPFIRSLRGLIRPLKAF